MPPSSPGPGLALVTGASSGIGAAFARAFAARGHRLVLVARREDRLRGLADELGGAHRVLALALDLTAAEAAARLRAELDRRRLAVDLLVNNAGVGHTGRFHQQPEERLMAMMDLDVRAVVALTRALLPGMLARGRGAVINVVSTSAFQPVPFMAVYAASKAFVLAFTEALATELAGSGVRVQALCPGLTATEFQQVAGTDRVRFNRTPAMRPEAVVAASLRGLDRGRLRVVPGWQNRAVARLQGWLPRPLVRTVAARLFEPSGQPADNT